MSIFKTLVMLICIVCFFLRWRDVRALVGPDNAVLRKKKLLACYAFGLLAIAVAFDIPEVYTTLDGALGGQNYAQLIMRACVYLLFLILGIATAGAFNSMLAQWLIAGRPGLIVLGVAMGSTITSHMLGAYQNVNTPDPYNSLAGWIYSLTWQLYLAYVSTCLLTALLPIAFRPSQDKLRRVAAGINSVGYFIVVLYPFVKSVQVINGNLYDWGTDMMKMTFVILIAIGTMMIWVARRLNARREVPAISGEV